jgi:glycosyltransferase involved in cell wall biosynthesis
LRVCFISSGLGVGGAEFALLRLCEGLAGRGVAASVISASQPGKVGELLGARGFRVTSLDLQRPVQWRTARSKLREHLSAAKPDIVHGWMYHGDLLATAVVRSMAPQPVLVWGIRQSLLATQDKLTTRLAVRACARLSQRPHAIVYNSEASRAQHQQTGFSATHSIVIMNGVDSTAFRPNEEARTRFRRAHGIGDDEVLVGHVARYHPSKDHRSFLEAAATAVSGSRPVRLVLVGDQVDASNTELTRSISSLGLDGRVLLLGRHDEAAELMPAIDIFCSSSSGMEGFQNVVAEAMSCAVPAIATDVGEARAIIGDTGVVVPPADPAGLAHALRKMINLAVFERLALGERARQHVASLFSQNACTEKYHNLLQSTLTGHQQGDVRHSRLP